MAPKLKFEAGERVLCFHGPLLYEAKCMENKVENSVPKFFIHYNGWNKNWNEWVVESRVLKWTEENLNKQKELKNNADGSKKKKKDSAKRALTTDDDTSRMRTRDKDKEGSVESNKEREKDKDRRIRPTTSQKRLKSESGLETEEEYISRIEVRLPLPDDLRKLLVEDWDMVTNRKKLVKLPRDPCVRTILKDYHASKANSATLADEVVGEVVDGLQTYFDHMLGTLLLFRFEKLQYNQILEENKDKNMSDIYGAEHLLRLFVKLPTLLAHTNMDEESLKVLITHLQEFMKYLGKNVDTLFLSDYEPATHEYCNMASQQ